MKRILYYIALVAACAALAIPLEACEKPPVDDNTEQGENKPDEKPDEGKEEETPAPDTPRDPMADGKLCILAIGNSFSQDSVEQYLWELFDAAGIEAVIGNMYIGGCSLETHWGKAQNGATSYAYRKMAGGTKTEQQNVAFLTPFSDEDWDIVTLQQNSGNSGQYSTYTPYLANLIAYVGEKCDADIWFHQTWAYMQGSSHGEFPKYDSDQMTMYNAIMGAVQSAMADHPTLAGVIPSGTAIQNGRTSYLGDTFNRDGYHLEVTYGRYTAACTWFEALSGQSVVGNTYFPATIDKDTAEIAQHAAHEAVTTPYSVTELTDYLTPPVVTGPLTSPLWIDFGSAKSSDPWNNSIAAVQIDGILLKDGEGNYRPATLSISPAFSESMSGVGDEPDKVLVSGGIEWLKNVWKDSLYIKGTAGAGDTAPVTITVGGLTASQQLDVTILATRYNGTRTARTTEFTLTGNRSETAQIQQGIRIGSGDGRYPTWEDVPFEEYTFSVKGITPAADGTLTLSVKGIDVGSTVVEGHISAICIAPAAN